MGLHDALNQAGKESELMRQEVEVDINLDGGRYATGNKVTIPFDIQFEYRSWGIKGAYFTASGKITVIYSEYDDQDSETEKEVELDLSELKHEWVEGGFYGPEKLMLFLNADGSVDYERSSLDVCYLKP